MSCKDLIFSNIKFRLTKFTRGMKREQILPVETKLEKAFSNKLRRLTSPKLDSTVKSMSSNNVINLKVEELRH